MRGRCGPGFLTRGGRWSGFLTRCWRGPGFLTRRGGGSGFLTRRWRGSGFLTRLLRWTRSGNFGTRFLSGLWNRPRRYRSRAIFLNIFMNGGTSFGCSRTSFRPVLGHSSGNTRTHGLSARVCYGPGCSGNRPGGRSSGRRAISSRQRTGKYKSCRSRTARDCELTAIRGSLLSVLNLRGNGASAGVADGSQLLGSGTSAESASTTVVADAISLIILYGIVVNVVNVRDIDVGDGAIVIHGSVVPVSAVVAASGVSEAVIDATVEANVRAPIACMPDIHIVLITPVRRSPEGIDPGRHHPCAGHPVVALRRIAPVAGRPDVIVAGAFRLAVIGERGWGLRGFQRLRVGALIASVIRVRILVVATGLRCGLVSLLGWSCALRHRGISRLRGGLRVRRLATGSVGRGEISIRRVSSGGLHRSCVRSFVAGT